MLKYKFVDYTPSTIKFYNQSGEMILKEPSLVAFNTANNEVLKFGDEVMSVKDLENIVIGSSFRNGAVAEFDLATCMMKHFLYKSAGVRKLLIRPRIAVCSSVDMTQVEIQALKELVLRIGGKDVLIIEKAFDKAIHTIPSKYKFIIEII